MTDTLLAPHQVEARCPKCASPKVDTFWHRGIVLSLTRPYPCSFWEAQEDAQEHLCRRCAVCGYAWASRTADAPEEPRGDL